MIPQTVKDHLQEYINQEVYVQIAIIKGKEKGSTYSAINKYFNSNHFRDLSEGRPYDHFIKGLKNKCLGKLKNSPMLDKKTDDKIIIELQKKLNNAHTQLVTNNNNVVDIKVKADYKKNLLGHAGFFWVNSGKVFNHIPNFLSSSYYKSIKREIIIDDYFKFIINNNLIKATCIKLKNYVHIGSMSEYNEYQYWEKYFSK